MTLSKLIQYQIIMDAFDSFYFFLINELIFPEYNKNKFIDGQIAYVLDGYNKYMII